MRTQKMRHFGKTVVAGIAAFMMLAQSFSVSACSADCVAEEQGAVENILYDAQFVDANGDVYPVSEISPQVICLKHEKYAGYFQTHVADGKGGCTVKTYEGVKCVICDTIWLGDWIRTTTYAKCPH